MSSHFLHTLVYSGSIFDYFIYVVKCPKTWENQKEQENESRRCHMSLAEESHGGDKLLQQLSPTLLHGFRLFLLWQG